MEFEDKNQNDIVDEFDDTEIFLWGYEWDNNENFVEK